MRFTAPHGIPMHFRKSLKFEKITDSHLFLLDDNFQCLVSFTVTCNMA